MAHAQVEMAWSLANSRTVLMEPVKAVVRISNYTGEALDLSPSGNARLEFDVEDRPTSFVKKTGRPLVRFPIIIPPNETRDVEVDLLDAYEITHGQSYMLTPMMEFDGMRFFGKRLALEVQPGLELFRRDYGVKSSGDSRCVTLRLIHRGRRDHLFFRMDNSARGSCLGVYDLGRVIRYLPPSVEQDASGRFHVFHQTGPDRFVHSRFDYNGRPAGVTFYVGGIGSIRMVRSEEGDVQVVGGNAYEEDPDHPGMFVAPALAPSHPYNVNLGELPPKGRNTDPRGKRKK
jgi:hypothetical protein